MLYTGVIAVLSTVVLPYFWMVSGSFKTTLEIQSADVSNPALTPSWIPNNFTLENYVNINTSVPMKSYFFNSMIISTGTMILSTIISLFAAYALARLKFGWKKSYTMTLFSTQMFPGIAFLIPYFVLFIFINRTFGIQLKNTYFGLIFTYTSFALPFSILMMRNYISSIPAEIDEQAMIDGCSRFQIVLRVIFPLALPGIVSVGIYSFIMGWSEILFASILTGQETKTVSIGLLDYITALSTNWAGMMAACILVTLPVLIFFTLLQKYNVSGLLEGSVKG
jgi:multiple sugar transport system permease protein